MSSGRRARGPALATALLLAACGGAAPPPEPSPIPRDTLLVVTPTPGRAPPRTPAPPTGRRYTVREGDTLSGIAARFAVSEDALRRANGIADPNALFAGQVLIVPPPEP